MKPILTQCNQKALTALKGGFFINQFEHGMYLYTVSDGKMKLKDGIVSYSGSGAVTTVNKIAARRFRFNASVSSYKNDRCYADYFFVKSDRISVVPNIGYALRIYSNGDLRIVRVYPNDIHEFELISTGLDFTRPHTFEVYVEQNDYWASELSVAVDGSETPYLFCDRCYAFELRENGYFSVKNENYTVTSTISDLEFLGEEIKTPDENAVHQVLLPDFIAGDNGERLIHWVFSDGYQLYKGVSIRTLKNEEISFVDYPGRTYVIPNNCMAEAFLVVAVSVDGKEAVAQRVELEDAAPQYTVEDQKRIIARPVDGTHAYPGFQTTDGREFVVKGFNYIELRHGDHSTFEPAIPDVNSADYDPLQTETWLKTLAKLKFNTVRCFLVTGNRLEGNRGLTGPAGSKEKLCRAYVLNLIDFLRRAHKYGIYVILNFTENEMIYSDYYRKMSKGATSQNILFSEDGIAAKADYLREILQIICDADPKLLNAILGIQGQNEFAYYNTSEPWVNTSGQYTYFDGTTYDMGDNESRHDLSRHALTVYHGAMRRVMDEFDPQMMLGEGSFTLDAVSKNSDDPNAYGVHPDCTGDNRFPVNMEDYLASGLDFFDMHNYWCGEQYYENEEKCMMLAYDNMKYESDRCRELRKTRPVILGEFGNCSTTDITDESISRSIGLLKSALNHGFAGGLYWTYQYIARKTDETDGRVSDYLIENLKKFYIFED